jgi:hypothetical protein
VFDVGGGDVQCKVSVSRHDTLPTAWYTSAWSSTGEFTFTGLSAGKYDLAAFSNGMKLARHGGLEVVQGDVVKDLVLQLEPCGEVRIQIDHPRWFCVCQLEQDRMRMGEVKYEPFSGLYMPAGPGKALVRLRNTETNEQIERTVNVEVGKTTVVHLDDQGH